MEYTAVKKKKTGSFCAILSATLYGFNAYCATQAYAGGSNPIAFTFYGSVICIVLIACIAKMRHINLKLQRNQVGWVVIIGILGTVTTFLLFSAYIYIASGIATVLHFTYPVYVAVGSVLFLKKKMTRGKIFALICSIAGIVCISDISGKTAGLGLFLALLSGVTYAGYIVLLEKTHLDQENSIFVCFHMTWVRFALALTCGFFGAELWVVQTKTAWFFTAFESISSLFIAGILFQLGVKYVGGMVASVFSMFEPLVCLIVGITLLGEQMNVLKIVGCILICVGILVVIYDEFTEENTK